MPATREHAIEQDTREAWHAIDATRPRCSKDAENTRLHVHVLQDVGRRRDVALALLQRGQHAREFRALGLAVHFSIGHVTQRF